MDMDRNLMDIVPFKRAQLTNADTGHDGKQRGIAIDVVRTVFLYGQSLKDCFLVYSEKHLCYCKIADINRHKKRDSWWELCKERFHDFNCDC